MKLQQLMRLSVLPLFEGGQFLNNAPLSRNPRVYGGIDY